MIKVKPGVQFAVIAPGGYMILAALKTASKTLGIDLTITSGTDGKHSGPTDPHLLGRAYDIRSNNLDPDAKPRVLAAIMGSLDHTRFYGFLEGAGTPAEHFHCQQAKGTEFTAEDLLNAQ